MPRVRLKPRRAEPFFARHPWVFSGAIDSLEGSPAPGDEVEVVAAGGEFVAWGLFNPHSKIQVRLYSWDQAERLDDGLWSRLLDRAFDLRTRLLGVRPSNAACRLVFSEADGLSGLIVDQYADWLLVQFTSLALAHRRDLFIRLLNEKLRPAGQWLRTEKGIRDAEGLEIADGPLAGSDPPRPIWIADAGLEYAVDVVEGQKTGFFLDQRENRLAAARYAQHRRVLDLFCFSGGFAMQCARHGAEQVEAVDGSESALGLAQANAERNGLADRITFVRSDAFKALEQRRSAGTRYDMLILDPPKMARQAKGVPEALRGYFSLNRLALDCLAPNGILVTCSCTGHVSRAEFEAVLADVAASAKRPLQLLESRGAAVDHPVSLACPETAYLKCCILRAGP